MPAFGLRAFGLWGACATLCACPGPTWQTVLDAQTLDRAVLSVWGSGIRDVYAVGGALGNGQETLALHFDGNAWRELHPGGTDTLWWTAGSGPTDVWMVGTRGRILHFDGAGFTETPSGTRATLFGVWAAAPDDAWAVGGTPGGGVFPGSDNDLVLHWDGTAWARVELPEPQGATLFKVWATSSENLYAVGEGGVLWHRSALGWKLESSSDLTTGTLLTVAGCNADDVYAVGGPEVLRRERGTWKREPVHLPGVVNGVACGAAGVLMVGSGGLKQRKSGGAWVDDSSERPYAGLHAAWADSQGTFWVAGGDFVSPSTPGKRRDGVVARFGGGRVPDGFRP